MEAYLKVSIGAGVVKWHQPALVFGVDIGAMLQEKLDNPGPVVSRGKM